MANTPIQPKLHLYKTAYSPLHDSYVSIKKVRYDDNGDAILDCLMLCDGAEIPMMFRVYELTRFVL